MGGRKRDPLSRAGRDRAGTGGEEQDRERRRKGRERKVMVGRKRGKEGILQKEEKEKVSWQVSLNFY